MLFSHHLLILQVLLPLLAAPICVIIRHKSLTWLITLCTSYLSLAIACLLFTEITTVGTLTYQLGGWPAPGGIEYHLDKLTAYVLLIVNIVAVVTLTCGKASLENEIASDRLALFYTAFLLNLTGLLGIIMTGDAFNLFVFIEISSLSSYAMISVSRDRRALYASFQYLIMGTIGASFILIAVGLLYSITGTLNINDLYQRLPALSNHATLMTALAFFTIGIGLKAAIFPLHLWLVNAYTYSPSIVSAFLAGTTTKVFLYVLIRFIYSVFDYQFILTQTMLHDLLMLCACGAILYGSWLAIKQDSLKRLLAYSSIAQIGYMVLGLSLATKLGLTACLSHLFNHALIKVALFLAVTNIIYHYQTDSLAKLSGIARQMPVTMACLSLAGLALIGVPLTAGFTSKWLLIQAAIHSGAWGLVILIVFSSMLAVIYIGKIIETAYFKTASTQQSMHPRSSYLFYIVLILLVLATIYFGLDTRLNVGSAAMIADDLFGQY